MSALGAIEVAEFDEVGDQPAAPLRLVTGPADGVRRPDIAGLAGVSRRAPAAPRTAGNAASAPAEPAPAVPERRLAGRSALVTPGAPALRPRPAPLRLTRRGRMVVVILAAVLATVAITAASVAFSGAQAANHGRPGAGYAGMHRIVVQPGQTLWSIAAQAEPSADPRQVIQEILTANSMTGSTVQAGQLLWVPK
jgi:LysM domain